MKITFEEFDKFQRKPLAKRLTKAISAFYCFTDGAYVLSLNAKFGSGKTTFLKMWEQYLISEKYEVIYLNAWETDFDEDPIIPLTACLLENIKTGNNFEKTKNALRGVLGATALIGNKFLEQATGIDVYATIKETEKDLKESDLKEIGEELYKTYIYKLNAYRELKKTLTKYVEGLQKKPLIILVDELDRVRPDYSVKFLEAIKHIFSIPSICFVIAVDREQLECSVKQLYGNLDFDNYYRRFITRECSLNISNNIELNDFITQLFNNITHKNAKLALNHNTSENIITNLCLISKIFNFTPRQIEYLFRIFTHLIAIEKQEYNNINMLTASILLIAIMINKPDYYHRIGTDNLMNSELYDYLRPMVLSNIDTYETIDIRYLINIALAFNLRKNDKENELQTVHVYNDCYNQSKENVTDSEIIHQLSRYANGNNWGDIPRESYFRSIYKRLEEWKAFFD